MRKVKATQALERTLDYLAEINVLKNTGRQGWRVAGAPPEKDSVASHVMEVAQISYILGKMEGLDAQKCVMLATFHDNAETRLGESDKLAKNYLRTPKTRVERAMKDQLSLLPKEIGKEIFELYREANYGESPEAEIVKDADHLEHAVQARIFDETGSQIPKDLMEKYVDPRRVRSVSAKELMEILRTKKNLSIDWFMETGWTKDVIRRG